MLLPFVWILGGAVFARAEPQVRFQSLVRWLNCYCGKMRVYSTILVTDPIFELENKGFIMDLFKSSRGYDSLFCTLPMNPGEISQLPDHNHLIIVPETGKTLEYLSGVTSEDFNQNHWLILTENMHLDNFTSIPGLSLYSQFYVHDPDEGVYEVYEVHPNLPRVKNMILDLNFYPKPSYKFQLLERRNNLSGVQIKVGYLTNKIFDPLQETGMFYNIFNAIAHHLNLNVVYIASPEHIYGVKMTDNTYNGLLGMLQRKTVDIGAMDFTKISTRSKDFEFSTYILRTKIMLFMQNKRLLELQWYNVFHWNFWIATGIMFLFFTIAVFVIKKYMPGHIRLPPLFLIYFTLLGQEPLIDSSKLASLRILIFTVEMFGVLLIWVFNGTLISVLTSIKTAFPIKDVEELLDNDDYNLIMGNGTAVIDMLHIARNTSDPVFTEIYDKLVKNQEDKVFIDKDLITENLAQNGWNVFLGEEFTVLTQPRPYICHLQSHPINLSPLELGWIYTKDFAYQSMFDFQLTKLKESGVIDREWKLFQTQIRNLDCPPLDVAASEDFVPIKMTQIYVIFIILLCGALISLGIVIFEWKLQPTQNTD